MSRSAARTSPSDQYWGINQTITYGSGDTILSSAGIIDTGSTLLMLASDVFSKYQNLTGATMDVNAGLLRITPEQYANLKSLFFNIAGVRSVYSNHTQTRTMAH